LQVGRPYVVTFPLIGHLRLHCRCYSVTSLNRTLILNPCVSFGEDPRTNTTKDTCVKRVWITFSRFTNSYSIVTTIGRIYVFSRFFLIGHLRLHCVRVLFNYFSLPDTYTQSVFVSFGEDPRTNTMKGTCVKRVWIIFSRFTNSYWIVITIGRIYVFSRLFLIGHLGFHCGVTQLLFLTGHLDSICVCRSVRIQELTP
jgi:hypothetical protein